MSLCINPNCLKPRNLDTELFCQACGTELLLEGRYRIVKILGGGGFGKTFEVSDRGTSKVLKVLITEHPKAISLFQQEAKVLSHLNHPGIPRTDGYFTFFPKNSQASLHCLVMEKIEGLDLEEYLKQRENRPIDEKLALEWLTQLTKILHEVHQQNFFHRDIKPANIMLRADGHLVLIDFGTAREATETYMQKVARQQVTGIVSAGYTPLEQATGKAVPQSDFYALGRTFVYLLTGKPPDEFPEDPRIGKLIWRESASQVSKQLAGLIDYLMEPFPGKRPQNAQMILQCLLEINPFVKSPKPYVSPPSVAPKAVQNPLLSTQLQSSAASQRKSPKAETKTLYAKVAQSVSYTILAIFSTGLLKFGIPATYRYFKFSHSQPAATTTQTETELSSSDKSENIPEQPIADSTSEPSSIPSENHSIPIPDGWKKIQGQGAELWLPGSYFGGDPNKDSEAIAYNLKLLVQDYQRRQEVFKQSSLAAFDSQLDSVGSLTNVLAAVEPVMPGTTVDQYLEELIKQLPSQYQILEKNVVSLNYYQTGRIVAEFTAGGTRIKQMFYTIPSGNKFWVIVYSASADEFDRQLLVFEESIRTFVAKP